MSSVCLVDFEHVYDVKEQGHHSYKGTQCNSPFEAINNSSALNSECCLSERAYSILAIVFRYFYRWNV